MDFKNREIAHIIESQMRQWELARHEATIREEGQARLADGVSGTEIAYIAISREAGSRGDEAAEELARLMGWQLYDKQILDIMAEDMKVHKSVLESVDEKKTSWIEDWIASFFNRENVGKLAYYRHMLKVLLVIAEHGKAVILGRGAGYVLPREKGLSVRVMAPLKIRSERYASQTGLSLREAAAALEKADRNQQKFAKDLLGIDIYDCKHYDLVFNTEKLTPGSVAKLIWRTLDQRNVVRR